MPQLYVLLRQNQNNGPFTLPELLRFNLQPGDLIWIEGQSAGWYYPQEIAALRPYLPFLKRNTTVAPATHTNPPSAAHNVFVAMPATPTVIEKEKPAIRPASVADNAEYTAPIKPSVVQTAKEKIQPTEKDPFLYKNGTVGIQRTKPLFPATKLVVALVIGGIALGAWLGFRTDAKQMPTTDVNSYLQPTLVPGGEEEATYLPEETTPDRKNNSVANKKSSKKERPVTNNNAVHQTAPSLSPAKEPAVDASARGTTATNEETTIEKAESSTGPVATQLPKEKKKLRDKIADLFKKEPAASEAPPAEEAEGERRAVRREADASLAHMVSIRLVIPNSWMMGVSGGKAILHNRSNQRIQKAIVDVFYYNDDDELLAKRTVTFTGVGGKENQTVSIPDHAEATRLDYKVISVAGKGTEPVARR